MTDTPDTATEGSDSDLDPTEEAAASAEGEQAVEHGELLEPVNDPPVERGSVTEPAKVMRIGSMVKQLLDEVRQAPLDERSRERLAEIYERSVTELAEALSPDLQEELRSLALPFENDLVPSDGELRVAQAQLVGWLEGLFHGIQATLFAQQFAARQQLEQMRQLPQGNGQQMSGDEQHRPDRPGTYL